MATGAVNATAEQYEVIDDIPVRLICNICSQLSGSPYLSGCCGSTFCKACLEKVPKICPICNETDFTTIRNLEAERAISVLRINCTNKEHGCDWVGEIKEYESSHVDLCAFENVECPNSCGEIMQRQYLAEHEEVCHNKGLCCQYCRKNGDKDFITGGHLDECPRLPIACPNKCEATVIREEMSTHRGVCPLQLINCDYFEVGCTTKVARQYILMHCEENIAQHLELTKRELACIVERVSLTESDLSAEVSKTAERLNQTTNNLSNTTAKLSKAEHELAATKNLLADAERKMREQLIQVESLVQTNLKQLESQIKQEQEKILNSVFSVAEWSSKLAWQVAHVKPDQPTPVLLRMPDISVYKAEKKEWFSSSFYTAQGGYRMCIGAHFGAEANGSNMTVNIHLMPGMYDDSLAWPFKGTIDVILLNQIGDVEHYCKEIVFNDDGNRASFKVNDAAERGPGFGYPKFISVKELHKTSPTRSYAKNNCLFFQATFRVL